MVYLELSVYDFMEVMGLYGILGNQTTHIFNVKNNNTCNTSYSRHWELSDVARSDL